MRAEFAHKDLPLVGLAAQVHFLGVNLVRNINEEDVEEVVAGVVRLEDYLDLVGLVCGDSALLRNHDVWNLLLMVLDTMDFGLEAEVDWER